MKNYFKEICSLFPMRRTKEQKSAFFNYVSGEFEPNRVKKDILEKEHENIVIGDIKSAKVIFTAHYDTCAVLPFPNFRRSSVSVTSMNSALPNTTPTASAKASHFVNASRRLRTRAAMPRMRQTG